MKKIDRKFSKRIFSKNVYFNIKFLKKPIFKFFIKILISIKLKKGVLECLKKIIFQNFKNINFLKNN